MLRQTTTTISVALAGQPNAGKTSIFNALTGSTGNVGNYPGVTVERRSGKYNHENIRYEVIDLPGTYSLGSFSPEERVAQHELLDNTPDVLVVVVDSTVLTRSLVFFAQVLQLGANTVLALNMADEARHAGQQIDVAHMSELLGCPVVETEGHRGRGVARLREVIAQVAANPVTPRAPVLGERLSEALASISTRLAAAQIPERGRDWIACRLLVDDRQVVERVSRLDGAGQLARQEAQQQREDLERLTNERIAVYVGERYHGFAHGLVSEIRRQGPRADARALSDSVDRVLAHRLLGLPFFFAIMYAIFWTTFTVGDQPMGWIEAGFARLGDSITGWWPATSLPALRSLVLDGIIAGVGGVVVFLPNIVLLFLGLALLEDTGYMARAAFLMDQLMHRFGLHGKSFLPLMTGFGCSVPGIMATRTLENERDRLITMLVLPLMSCGARLPIWMLLVPAFFPPQLRSPILMLIYLGGALLALVLAAVLRKTLFKGQEAPFVMELPPYRLPTWRALVNKMSERSLLYVRKAGTVILAISIVMWFITAYPRPQQFEIDTRIAAGQVEIVDEGGAAATSTPRRITGDEAASLRAGERLRHSVAGRIGGLLEPVLEPLGYDWKLATGLLGSFAAKEVFVAQMGIIHSLGETDEESAPLRAVLARNYSPLVGVSLIIFLLIATPCMATVAVTHRESGRWRWALLQFGGLTGLAYVLALVVYQGGRLLGLE